jgi:hypothetical protein
MHDERGGIGGHHAAIFDMPAIATHIKDKLVGIRNVPPGSPGMF